MKKERGLVAFFWTKQGRWIDWFSLTAALGRHKNGDVIMSITNQLKQERRRLAATCALIVRDGAEVRFEQKQTKGEFPGTPDKRITKHDCHST